MIDRHAFQPKTLANGVEYYASPLPIDFTTVYIQLNRGTAHNTATHLPGTYHFLEHMCCAQSACYPEANSFDRAVGMTGGWANAGTGSFHTTYQLSAPNHHIASLLDGFYARVFEPVYADEVLANQRQVVANERLRRERWYPGSSEVSWYENTQWQYDVRFPLQQIFGLDEDLANLDARRLEVAHREYVAGRIRVLSIGPAHLQPLLQKLERLDVKPIEAEAEFETMRWVNQDFHVKHFRDMSRHILTVAGFVQPPPDVQTARRLRFLLHYLTNNTHGALYSWLRHELGWSYGVSSSTSADQLGYAWDMEFPVNSLAQIELVRREWRDRVETALRDTESIQREVDRLLGSSAYWNMHPQESLDSALSDLDRYDRIISDNEWRSYIQTCGDQSALMEAFSKFFDPLVIGAYCAAPEVG